MKCRKRDYSEASLALEVLIKERIWSEGQLRWSKLGFGVRTAI